MLFISVPINVCFSLCVLQKNFQVIPDSENQAQLGHRQGHKKLEAKFPYHGAHGFLTYDLHDL